MFDEISRLVTTAGSASPTFPPTLIFNEGWMLRLILDWLSRNRSVDHPLSFEEKSHWYSEGLLPSPFRARRRGDPRAEARTHADGLVGQLLVGSLRKADAALTSDATQLLVLEAKMSSALSAGTRNAPTFDQASRNVACMAEMLRLSGRRPAEMTSLAFFVVAPASSIEQGLFAPRLLKPAIEVAVTTRAQAFPEELPSWINDWFLPTLGRAHIEALAWEDVLDTVKAHDAKSFSAMRDFYAACLEHNQRTLETPPA